jgi:hypothetical protein
MEGTSLCTPLYQLSVLDRWSTNELPGLSFEVFACPFACLFVGIVYPRICVLCCGLGHL